MSVIALYVQKGDTPYRQFFQDNLAELQRGFSRYQYNLLFLPSITRSENPSFNEGLRQYLEIYYPSFRRLSAIQQQQALFIVASTSQEEDVYRQLDEMFHLNLPDGAFIFYIKPGHFDFEQLPSDLQPEQALAKYLDSNSAISEPKQSFTELTPRDTSVLLKSLNVEERKEWVDFDFDNTLDHDEMSVVANKFGDPTEVNGGGISDEVSERGLPKEVFGVGAMADAEDSRRLEVNGVNLLAIEEETIITPELQRLFDTVNALELGEGLRQLLDLTIGRVLETIAAANTNNLGLSAMASNDQIGSLKDIRFNYDGQLFLGDALVNMNPICRSVYRLFLNYPEGIELRLMSEYREELHQIYLSMATHTDITELTRRVNLLCDPRDNSINEKLSTINRIFRDLLGPDNCIPYQILGVRGAAKKINLRREFVILHGE